MTDVVIHFANTEGKTVCGAVVGVAVSEPSWIGRVTCKACLAGLPPFPGDEPVETTITSTVYKSKKGV